MLSRFEQSVPSLTRSPNASTVNARRRIKQGVTTTGAWEDSLLLPLTHRMMTGGPPPTTVKYPFDALTWVDTALGRAETAIGTDALHSILFGRRPITVSSSFSGVGTDVLA
eukprot:4501605-Pyramimonas_sp.AAC.1